MVQDKKTLIILTPGFAKDETDSTCIPLHQNLVLALKKICPGLEIIILSFQYPYITEPYKWHDMTIIPFSGKNKGGLKKLLIRRNVKATFKKINRRQQVIGMVSFWYGECAFVGKKLADRHGIPHFCWLQGQDVKKENKYPGITSLRPDEIIALSDFSKTEFEKNHRLKLFHIITPGIEPGEFDTTPKEKDIDIIAAGSLIPLKQFEVVIAIVAQLKKQLPGIKAIMIGDGPEKQKLQDAIVLNKLQSNIVLTGTLSNTETLAWMQRAKILLHPSFFEGFGVVMIEALYAGCKVISFCEPMNREIENWYIAKSNEEMKELALAILENKSAVNNKVLFSSITDTAEKMLALFPHS